MKGKKGNRRGNKIEAKWGKREGKRGLWAFLHIAERLYKGNQQRGYYQREKAQGGFKETVFSEEMHSLKTQQ